MLSARLGVLIVSLWSIAAPARAIPVTFAYEGLVSEAWLPPDRVYHTDAAFLPLLGERVRLEFTFESSAPSPWRGRNFWEIASASVSVGSLSSHTEYGTIGFEFRPTTVNYHVDLPRLSGPTIGGLPLEHAHLWLFQDLALAGDSPPRWPSDPAAYSESGIRLVFPVNWPDEVHLWVVPVHLVAVPEPSGLALVLLPLAVGSAVRFGGRLTRRRAECGVEPRPIGATTLRI